MKKVEQEFSKEQIRALADFWPVFANPKFVYEVQDEVKGVKWPYLSYVVFRRWGGPSRSGPT